MRVIPRQRPLNLLRDGIAFYSGERPVADPCMTIADLGPRESAKIAELLQLAHGEITAANILLLHGSEKIEELHATIARLKTALELCLYQLREQDCESTHARINSQRRC